MGKSKDRRHDAGARCSLSCNAAQKPGNLEPKSLELMAMMMMMMAMMMMIMMMGMMTIL